MYWSIVHGTETITNHGSNYKVFCVIGLNFMIRRMVSCSCWISVGTQWATWFVLNLSHLQDYWAIARRNALLKRVTSKTQPRCNNKLLHWICSGYGYRRLRIKTIILHSIIQNNIPKMVTNCDILWNGIKNVKALVCEFSWVIGFPDLCIANNFIQSTMSRDSLSGLGILTRNSMSLHSRRGSNISLLAASTLESFHSVDDRNWSWSALRVCFGNIYTTLIFSLNTID